MVDGTVLQDSSRPGTVISCIFMNDGIISMMLKAVKML